jgi:hypothetical protein
MRVRSIEREEGLMGCASLDFVWKSFMGMSWEVASQK